MTRKVKAAIIGSGNIGTDLMIKILRHGQHIEMGAMVGIDPASDGLARAQRMGVAITHEGVEGLTRLPVFNEIDVVFDATSAGAHVKNEALLRERKPGLRMIDLTPAAIGPYCIPVVNGDDHLDATNVNMVTCGGQATIPMVAAVSRVARCITPKSSPASPARAPAPARAPTSMSSPRPRPRPSRWLAGRRRARRSSS